MIRRTLQSERLGPLPIIIKALVGQDVESLILAVALPSRIDERQVARGIRLQEAPFQGQQQLIWRGADGVARLNDRDPVGRCGDLVPRRLLAGFFARNVSLALLLTQDRLYLY
jgi:hypothetical protein